MYARKSSEYSSEDEPPASKRQRLSPPTTPKMAPQAKGSASAATGGSFASRMMAKMGYVEGQGLGAAGRGRLAPIETQLRPQGAGLGAVKEKTKKAKEEEKREAAFHGLVLEDSSEEEKKRRREKKKAVQNERASGGKSSVTKKKPKVKTIVEIEEESGGLRVPDVLKSIIDATGSETKLLSSAAGLMSQDTVYVPSETEEAKLARRAQRDVTLFSDEWMSLKAREDFYADEGVQLSTAINEEEEKAMADTSLLAKVDDLQKLVAEHSDIAALSIAWKRYIQVLQGFEQIALVKEEAAWCHEIVVAAIYPLFRTSMSQWSPLDDPIGASAHIETLRLVLGIEVSSDDKTMIRHDDNSTKINLKRSTTHYETMIYTFWLPPVRTAITQEWNPQDPAPLLKLVEAWKPVLPPFILANVIDQLVVKRLIETVATWNTSKPSSRKSHVQPPHFWLFPWLQYLDDQHTDPKNPTGLLSDVKRKFKSVLSNWDLSRGLVPGLDSWQSIFQSDLSNMLIRYLLPRFRPHLSQFEVDPGDQDLEKLEDVLQWSRFFHLSTFAEVIKSEFFPKWHQCLYIWLTSPSVNYDEVSQWYQWWKSEIFEKRLSREFNELPAIAREWQRGLECMLQAAGLGPEAAATRLPPPTTESGPRINNRPPPAQENGVGPDKTVPVAIPNAQSIQMPTTFKDVVEEWCITEGLHLVPLREADMQTGLPLFRITASASLKGGVVVYLKGDVIWVRGAMAADGQGRTFVPRGLDGALVKRAEGR